MGPGTLHHIRLLKILDRCHDLRWDIIRINMNRTATRQGQIAHTRQGRTLRFEVIPLISTIAADDHLDRSCILLRENAIDNSLDMIRACLSTLKKCFRSGWHELIDTISQLPLQQSSSTNAREYNRRQ